MPVRELHTPMDFRGAMKESGNKLFVCEFYSEAEDESNAFKGRNKQATEGVSAMMDVLSADRNVAAKTVLARINVKSCKEHAALHKITTTPTILIVYEHKVVDRLENPAADKMKETVEGHVKSLASRRKPNEYYAGDSQGLLAPGDGGDVNTTVQGIFQQARDNGGVAPGEFVSHQLTSFTGEGRRLGYEMSGSSPPVQNHVKEEVNVRLAFYKNGFIVNDKGPLRRLEDPANKPFLEAVDKGYVPDELAKEYPKKDVNIHLEDRSQEDYVDKFAAFQGGGQSLGGGSTRAAAAPAAVPTSAPTEFVFNDAEPSTRLMIQLQDGTRQPVHANHERHTVADLRAAIRGLLTDPNSTYSFVARDGLRPRPLTDETQTIEAAKCKNCVIMLK